MKIKDTVREAKFEPVMLEVTFESLKELEVFWGMTNAPDREIEDNMSEHGPCNHLEISLITSDLFAWADRQIQKYD